MIGANLKRFTKMSSKDARLMYEKLTVAQLRIKFAERKIIIPKDKRKKSDMIDLLCHDDCLLETFEIVDKTAEPELQDALKPSTPSDCSPEKDADCAPRSTGEHCDDTTDDIGEEKCSHDTNQEDRHEETGLRDPCEDDVEGIGDGSDDEVPLALLDDDQELFSMSDEEERRDVSVSRNSQPDEAKPSQDEFTEVATEDVGEQSNEIATTGGEKESKMDGDGGKPSKEVVDEKNVKNVTSNEEEVVPDSNNEKSKAVKEELQEAGSADSKEDIKGEKKDFVSLFKREQLGLKDPETCGFQDLWSELSSLSHVDKANASRMEREMRSIRIYGITPWQLTNRQLQSYLEKCSETTYFHCWEFGSNAGCLEVQFRSFDDAFIAAKTCRSLKVPSSGASRKFRVKTYFGTYRSREETDKSASDAGLQAGSSSEDIILFGDKVGDELQHKEEKVKSNWLIVKDLPMTATTGDLVKIFKDAIKVNVVDDSEGLCKGYAFVLFANTEAAVRNLSEKNDTYVDVGGLPTRLRMHHKVVREDRKTANTDNTWSNGSNYNRQRRYPNKFNVHGDRNRQEHFHNKRYNKQERISGPSREEGRRDGPVALMDLFCPQHPIDDVQSRHGHHQQVQQQQQLHQLQQQQALQQQIQQQQYLIQQQHMSYQKQLQQQQQQQQLYLLQNLGDGEPQPLLQQHLPTHSSQMANNSQISLQTSLARWPT